MLAFTLAFLCGILFLQIFSTLPSILWAYLIFACAILFLILKRYWAHLKIFTLPFAFALGFAWCLHDAHNILSWSLPSSLEGKPIAITGTIASIPNKTSLQTSFLFSLQSMQNQPSKTRLHLNWFACQERLHVGDQWRLQVHLKKIHGLRNPGGMDYEAAALQQRIRATGYVLPHTHQQLLTNHGYSHPLDRFRQAMQQKIQQASPVSPTAHWLIALIVGERHNIPPEQWQVLRNTGTNHLMAIAGLHIGLMSGLAFTIVTWCWRRTGKLALYLPAIHAGAYAALLMALFYSAMAGFSIPTKRALIMMAVFLFAMLCRRKITAWHAWSTALFIELLLNPLSVLSESLWLSFGTIALIIYGMSGRLAPNSWWWKWGRSQWVISIGLLPLSLVLFQQASLISFIANSIAIPWLGFFILPFCFIGSLLLWIYPAGGKFLLLLADKSLAALWWLLTKMSHWTLATWHHADPNIIEIVALLFAVVLLLLPRGFPGRYLGVIGFLPVLLLQPKSIAEGEVLFTLLDVGQGLATVVQTKNHTLVYDTGARLSANWDMGESVVSPFLYTLGVKQIDMLVISHGDNDHSGGASAVLQQFPVREIRTSIPAKFPLPQTRYCLQGQQWQWDGVQFTFLYPTPTTLGLNNDSCCVLRIEASGHVILLPGDMEKFAERELLKNPQTLPADVLVAPHHGSKTSALSEFVQAASPRYVLYAIGYRNRYHFPHVPVVEKYTKIGAIQLDSVQGGAIQFQLGKDRIISPPHLYRMEHHHYWNE